MNENPIAAVEPAALAAYLASAGWHSERSDQRRSIWSHPTTGLRVFVPGTRGPDFQDLVLLSLREIATAEQRDLDDMLVDIAWMRFDRLHAKRSSGAHGLTFSDGIDMHQALYDTIVAAARAATEHRRVYSGRRPASADNYIEQVRLIPSAQGSFVVRALLPLTKPPEQEVLPLEGLIEHDVRAISKGILHTAKAAIGAAHDVANGASTNRWDDAVNEGVSANLCDALSRIPASSSMESGNVDLQVTWTWAAPAEPLPAVTIPVGLVPVLQAGGDYLKDEPEEHSIRVTGLITKLHRETATGPGEITVRGFIEGWDTAVRSVRIELDEASYRLAIAAHDSGTSVQVSALVRRLPRGLEVLRVEDFRVLA